MARSSGGGSRSGGSSSRSSSSSSRGGRSSGPSHRISSTPFRGARKFQYHRGNKTHYVYSDTDLRQLPERKPRYWLYLLYAPFFIAIIVMAISCLGLRQDPLDEYTSSTVQVFDEADILTSKEESGLTDIMKEFKNVTGITTQVMLVDVDEWSDNGSLEDWAYYRYYHQFDDENCWLLVYSQENDGYGEWYWEGVQGDNTIGTMDVFLNDFNTNLHSELLVGDAPDVAGSFIESFELAIDKFENQPPMRLKWEMILPTIFMTLFIGFHSYVLVFAGSNRKYSYKELEEVVSEAKSKQTAQSQPVQQTQKIFECQYCGYKTTEEQSDNRCKICGALIQ